MPPTDERKTHFISPRLLQKLDYQTPLSKFFAEATYMSRRTEPESLDFTFGDAHEMPLPGFVEALQRWSVPQNSSWYAYKGDIPQSRVTVSTALKEQRGLSILPEDIFMTNGTFVGLAICLQMLAEEGDEVIVITPPWLGYKHMVHLTGAVTVGVPVDTNTFEMDLEAIASAITQKTRVIIVNSRHNPTLKHVKLKVDRFLDYFRLGSEQVRKVRGSNSYAIAISRKSKMSLDLRIIGASIKENILYYTR
ncbi:MAG: aminotransferase class I/II-fold pyridoxal phosphate-dependent enzyme [Rhizonema sp. PD38]|nr:aminotransferase class I/II-fold pyridoxal phosphate-dependent enzyme [Rhizonema sp. PD38]